MNRTLRRRHAARNSGWEPWQEVPSPTSVQEDQIAALMKLPGVTREQAIETFWNVARRKIWRNNVYQVSGALIAANEKCSEMIHLSIKRIDQKPVGIERFRDFQRIKNELVGPEHEAVELYPAESRLVDTANQYHLWVFTNVTDRFQFGMSDRRLVIGESIGDAVQQPFD